MKAFLKHTLLVASAALWATVLPACGMDDGNEAMDSGEGEDTATSSGDSDTGTGETDTNPGETDTGAAELPFAASCADQVKSGGDYEYGVCGEYFFEADDTLTQENQTSCSVVGGTWSTERCVTDGAVGSCTTVDEATIVNYYFDVPESAISSRQTTCEGFGGTWTAL